MIIVKIFVKILTSEHRSSKSKETKKNKGKKNKTHKQTSDQTHKRTNKQRNEKNKQAVSPVFFFGPMQWLEPLRVAKRNKGKKNKTQKQTSDQTNKQTSKQRNNKDKQAESPVFWSDAMAGAIACGQTKQIKKKTISKQSREPTQNHGLYM